MRAVSMMVLLACAFAVPAQAQTADDNYNIMAPEKGAPEKPAPAKPELKKGEAPKRHPRGSSTLVTPTPLPPPLHYNPPPVQAIVPPQPQVPPPMYVPQTGMVLPNLPMIGNGPGGAETSQDRALRCAHQAGAYGPAQTGDRNAYVGSCINQ